MEYTNVDFQKDFPEWQGASAFNTYWQYNFVSRESFYANIKAEYRTYMQRWVKNYLWWYDGWCPYFHHQDQGIFSTKLATALVNGTAKKVFGGQLYFKTREKEELKKDAQGKYIVNPALSYLSSQWCEKGNFESAVRKAITFAAAGGSAVLKIDKQGKDLIVSALRFDSFYPTVSYNGKITDILCFIRNFVKLDREKDNFSNFYIVEHRYFGDYVKADGKVLKNCPLVKYEIRRTTGTITTGQLYGDGEKLDFRALPSKVRSEVAKAFNGVQFDEPILLPFADHLGVELVNWTDCVSALPELPFGESLLANIMPYLQAYDYYFSAFSTDMYIGRGKVLLPKTMQSAKAKDGGDYDNSGLDKMIFTQIQSLDGDIKPTPIQFDLRSQGWKEIRDTIIQNIAINTGINLSTIASFLTDTNAARTAREISTEESETALFVQDKRNILEKPINRILRLVTTFYGFADEIVIRWSAAGLSNIYSRADLINSSRQAGTMSLKKALQMLNEDADEYELQQEYEDIKSEKEKEQQIYDGEFYQGINNDSKQATEPTGVDFGRVGSGDTGNGATGIPEKDTETENNAADNPDNRERSQAN